MLSVDVDPNDTVDDMKDAVRTKAEISTPAHKGTFFLAKKNGDWLSSKSADAKALATYAYGGADSWFATALDPTDAIIDALGDAPKRVIHVLFRLPQESEAERAIATTRKQRVLEEMKVSRAEEEIKLKELQEKTRAREEQEDREARIPLKRKRAWDELNKALLEGHNKKSRAFSNQDYDRLPARFKPKLAMPDSAFRRFMDSAPPVSDPVLQAMVENMERKRRVYKIQDFWNESTRVQFMSGVFEHVADAAQNIKIAMEENLRGQHVKAHGRVEFLFSRGGKQVCVVEAKDWNFSKGCAQSVLGMEVIVDNSEEECVYGIVTNYTRWIFMKRTDEGIEEYICTLKEEGDLHVELKKIASCVQAILLD